MEENVNNELDHPSWDSFFTQFDQKLTGEEGGEGSNSNNCEAHTGVATLPHKKAICYGVCTVSEAPKLVKCEDCGLVVKMVAFGHHRKLRHKDSLFLTQQDAESGISTDSDSEDDCQGFLLSPPHFYPSVAYNTSTSEGSLLEHSEESLKSHSRISSIPNTPAKMGIENGGKNATPQYYGVEKRNDLRLVLKLTPDKCSVKQADLPSTFQKQEQQRTIVRRRFTNPNKGDGEEQVKVVKKPRKAPIVRVFGSKKRRRGGKKKATTVEANAKNVDIQKIVDRVEEELNLLDDYPSSSNDIRQYKNIDGHKFADPYAAELISNDPQLVNSTSSAYWDPRQAAERPIVVRGSTSGGVLGGGGAGKPVINKVMPKVLCRKPAVASVSLAARRTTSMTEQTGPIIKGEQQQQYKREASSNLDKVAGPSILKRKETTDTERMKQFEQQLGKGKSVIERLFKYPGITVTTLRAGNGIAASSPIFAPTTTELATTQKNQQQATPTQNQQHSLQLQFAAMQQQQQKNRMMTRDFDALSTHEMFKGQELFSEVVTTSGVIHGTKMSHPGNSSSAKDHLPRQQPTTIPASPSDSMCSSSNQSDEPATAFSSASNNNKSLDEVTGNRTAQIHNCFINKAKNTVNNKKRAFTELERQQQQDEKREDMGQTERLQQSMQQYHQLPHIAAAKQSYDEPQQQTNLVPFYRRIVGTAISTPQQVVKSNNNSAYGGDLDRKGPNVTWRKIDSPIPAQLPRKQSLSTAASGNSSPRSLTGSGTRFVPVDPQGLSPLRKNSPLSTTTAPSASNSHPFYSGNQTQQSAQSVCETKPGSSWATQDPTVKEESTDHYYNANAQFSVSAPPTTAAIRKRQHFEPAAQQPLAKRFRPIAPKQGDLQNGIARFDTAQAGKPTDQQIAFNIDTFSPAIIQQRITTQHHYIQQKQPRQISNAMMPQQNAPIAHQQQPVTINAQRLHSQNRQQIAVHQQNSHQQQQQQRYYAGNAQELGKVFTIMQQQQQQPQQYVDYNRQPPPPAAHHHQQQYPVIRHQQNGIIRTIAVNTAQLSKNVGHQLKTDYGGGGSTSGQSQSGAHYQNQHHHQIFAYGPTSFSGPVYHQMPPDTSWEEFVAGRTPGGQSTVSTNSFPSSMAVDQYGQGSNVYIPDQHYQSAGSLKVGPMIPMSSYKPEAFTGAPSSAERIRRTPYHPPNDEQKAAPHQQYPYLTAAANHRLREQQPPTPAFLQPQPVDMGGFVQSQQQHHGVHVYGSQRPQQHLPLPIMAENSGGTENADAYVSDPPPVLEAEGRFPISSTPSQHSASSFTAPLHLPQKMVAPSANAPPEDRQPTNTSRSSSASGSDLDLREALQQPLNQQIPCGK